MKAMRKYGAAEWKMIALFLAVFLMLGLWAVLIGHLRPAYGTCIAHHPGKGGALFCSFSLLDDGPLGWLTFLLQWLPFGALLAWMKISADRNERRLAPRREKDRARRAARKAASRFSSNSQE